MDAPVLLEIFTDYVCPWCYLCTPTVDRLKREYPLAVRWIHYPLHPETPPEGSDLSPAYLEFQQRIAQLAAEEGLPFTARSRRCNSRRAQELGKWADTQPDGEGLHDTLYRAYFVDDADIWDVEVLAALAEKAGLDGSEARDVITEGRFRDEVALDWERAQREGVTGVPTFFDQEIRIVGAQPYDTLERFVQFLLSRAAGE